MLNRARKHQNKPDYLLLVAILGMCFIGLAMVYSSSIVVAHTAFEDDYYFLKKQASAFLVGLVGLIIFMKINYKSLEKFATLGLIATIGTLFLVLLMGFSYQGSQRWIHIAGVSIQPSEFIKLTFVVYLASWLAHKKEAIRSFSYGLMPFLVLVGLICALLLAQPDMGTMITIGIISFSVFFVAGASLSHLALIGAGAVATLVMLIKITPYRMARVTAFLDPEHDAQGIGYHINQALLAVGSGGLLGLGFGQSVQKYNYLPEVVGDSMFAVMSEELGFVRVILILAAYTFIAWRGYLIAKNTTDVFGRLLAAGITSWFAFQAIINIMAMVALLPLTGIPLPFVSYGGSALVSALCGAGILLSISRYQTRN